MTDKFKLTEKEKKRYGKAFKGATKKQRALLERSIIGNRRKGIRKRKIGF